MVKKRLATCLQQAVTEAQREGSLVAVTLPEVVIEHPQNPEHGDFASGLPLKLARTAKEPPLVIAEKIAKHISLYEFVVMVGNIRGKISRGAITTH